MSKHRNAENQSAQSYERQLRFGSMLRKLLPSGSRRWITPIVMLLLLLGRKTVHFETGCDSKVKDQKVKKGSLVTRPEQPVRPGRAFAGWYADESCTKRWDFDNDKVEDNMTLYAKWL